MPADLRATTQYRKVLEYLRALHGPGFGRPMNIREAQVSYDGASAVVTADVMADLEGAPRTAVYTAVDGRFRPVSTGGGSARSGRFSPDGRTLAFLSDRGEDGVYQLYLLVDGTLGEAERAPAVPGTVEYLHWSPDGRRILLGVAGLGADLSGGQGSGTNRGSGGGAPAWFPKVDGDVADEAWRSLWSYTVATGALERVSPQGLNCWEAGWCGPDRIAAITSDSPGEDDWYGAVLSLIGLDGAVRTVLDSEVQLGLPTGSPDGRWLSVAEAVCSDRWLVAGDLLLVDADSGAVRRIDTAGTDVTRLEWIDAGRLGYVGVRHLDSVAGVVRTGDGRVTEALSTAKSCGGTTFHPDGSFTADGRVLTIQESYELPQQLVLTAADGDQVLASVADPGTDYLRSVAGSAQALSWSAPDGTEIEGIVCKPAGDGPFPLVVNIHGGPVWGFRDTWSMSYPWVPLLVSRGYAVLNPNPRGSSGRGQSFAGAVVGDMGGADTHDYLSGIDALVERGIADPARIGLIGRSYGGFMSSWLVTQDTRFAAAVPLAPVTDWYSQSFTSNIAAWGNRFLDADPEQPGTRAHTRSPVLHAGKTRTPCLNVAGALDACTPPGQAQEFHQALRARGVPSGLVIYPQEGHGVRAYPAQIDFLTRVLDWFERYMPAV
ncbi:S9 family peptidase [Streptomyces sp. YIM 130001]|uniref:S9 family peptidase n=1 Tax=Streptomyces sp. YIM 130001 TaxID=2259644 RepID=UPI001F09F495|nr:S9 family peptidase [Streptomyces sp. YIM 130001]